MITTEQIQEKLKQLVAQRDQVQAQAFQLQAAHNAAIQNVSAYNGAIQALEQLLSETAEQPTNGAINEDIARVLHE